MALTAEQQEDADLEAGFTKDPPTPTEKPVVVEVKTDVPAQKPDDKPPEHKVEYVQLTKEEHGRLLALVDKTNEWNTKLDRALGTVGGVNEIVKKMQATTPAGVTLEYDDADFAELEENYPDLAAQVKAILRKGKVKGTASAAAADDPKKTEEPPAKSVAEQLKEQRVADNMQMLDEAFPQWKATVGYSATPEDRAKLPYRIWLASKDEEYRARIGESQSAFTIGRSIDEFHRDQRRKAAIAKQRGPTPPQRPDPKIVARQDRIAGSVQPRGDGAPPPRKDTSDDDFERGFHGR